VFRSWITHDLIDSDFSKDKLPKPLYALVEYDHPKQNLNYFKAQRDILPYQGANNLWFVGVYTHDTVSHESVVLAASKVARALAPDSVRLNKLMPQQRK
jgi:predicted NAD/FAD-binding protein